MKITGQTAVCSVTSVNSAAAKASRKCRQKEAITMLLYLHLYGDAHDQASGVGGVKLDDKQSIVEIER